MTLRSNVAILAGGLGTRLQARTNGLPKPMAPILGMPVLGHQILLCRRHGFDRIALLVHHRSDAIRDAFGDGSEWGVRLSYHVEQEARGTSGALFDAQADLEERFLVLYGDTYADVDLTALWRAHRDGVAATLFLHPNDHPHDSDLIELDPDGNVLALHPYPHQSLDLPNMVNAAMYVMERDALVSTSVPAGRSDIARDLFPAMLHAGSRLRGYVTPEYIKDMGTPERLDKVSRDIVAGLPERLSGRQRRAAVFLDRDGTINHEVGHLAHPDQLTLIEGAGAAIRRLNRAGRLAICVTNQPVIARGDVSADGLTAIHHRLDGLLGKEGAYLDRLYYCPHHPDRGFPGEVSELKFDCTCRKPESGLIDRGVRDLEVDRRASWMVGDRTADVSAGKRAGLRTILLNTGFAGRDARYSDTPDYVCTDLGAAIDWILDGHPKLVRELLPIAAACEDAGVVLIGGGRAAGKTFAARTLAEIVGLTGRLCHVMSLDPSDTAPLDEAAIGAAIAPLLDPRESGTANPSSRLPADSLLIVDACFALAAPTLAGMRAVRLFVDTDAATLSVRRRNSGGLDMSVETIAAEAEALRGTAHGAVAIRGSIPR